eukprot:g4113.t1
MIRRFACSTNKFVGRRGFASASTSISSREPNLYTPGPLTTSLTVKQAMMIDLGSRDERFLNVIQDVQKGLLDLANVRQPEYECVLMQGSGTFAVESVLGSVVPSDGNLLILSNGAYGDRMKKMCEILNINHEFVRYSDKEVPKASDAVARVTQDESITHVATIHHETTTGALNPIGDIGRALRDARPDVSFIVDSMSAFGAYPVDMQADNVSFLVSSANKCIEGVPGFAFALCDHDQLVKSEGVARSLSLDLFGQWKGINTNGQFRFTPPTHSLLAFHQALKEHEIEGGAKGRLDRYEENFQVLSKGMKEMGFNLYLEDDVQGAIISTFLVPDDPKFDFPEFYNRLSDLGAVIYPGKLTEADSLRIGSIGRLFVRDMHFVLRCVRQTLDEMDVQLPVTQKTG